MEFSVGDHVIHPKHGAGKIAGVEQLEFVEGFEHYYVIEIGNRGLTVSVPIRQMETLGVRPIMSRSRLNRVLDKLHSAPRQLPENFKIRQTNIQKKLETALPLKVAEVVRDLAGRKRRDSLSSADLRLLDHSRDVLATEIALVTDIDPSEAHQMISNALIDDIGKNLEPSI